MTTTTITCDKCKKEMTLNERKSFWISTANSTYGRNQAIKPVELCLGCAMRYHLIPDPENEAPAPTVLDLLEEFVIDIVEGRD